MRKVYLAIALFVVIIVVIGHHFFATSAFGYAGEDYTVIYYNYPHYKEVIKTNYTVYTIDVKAIESVPAFKFIIYSTCEFCVSDSTMLSIEKKLDGSVIINGKTYSDNGVTSEFESMVSVLPPTKYAVLNGTSIVLSVPPFFYRYGKTINVSGPVWVVKGSSTVFMSYRMILYNPVYVGETRTVYTYG